MADIDIEQKGPGVWPWIIGLLVLALLIWGVMEMFGGDRNPVGSDPMMYESESESPSAPPASFPEATTDTSADGSDVEMPPAP